MKLKTFIAIPLVVAAAVVGALADEGRIPIFQPTVITSPGHYIVTRNISVTSGDVIQIASSNVDLDLDGHVLSGTGSSGNIVTVLLIQPAANNITVRNGKMFRGIRGVSVDGAATVGPIRLENLEIRSSLNHGIYLHGILSAEVISCRLYSPASGGFANAGLEVTGAVFGSTARITDNLVQSSAAGGIRLEGLWGAEIRGNAITGSLGGGAGCPSGCNPAFSLVASAGSEGSRVEGNEISLNSTLGALINSPGTLFVKNTLANNTGCGIQVTSRGNLILENVVHGGTTFTTCGVQVDEFFNTLQGNLVTEILGFGVVVTGNSNLLDNNLIETVNTTGSCAIRFDSFAQNVYRNNILRSISSVCGVANINGGGNL